MAYDHNKKAGNEGDVAKHVALLTALTGCMRNSTSTSFRYADLYAGYYNSTLSGHDWKRGIGSLNGERQIKNEFVREWLKLLPKHPKVGDSYPGSTRIAICAAELAHRRIEISAYDVSRAAATNLRKNLRPPHRVFEASAQASDSAVQDAHFLFIDPPSRRCLASISRDYLGRADKNLLVWLPMSLTGASQRSAAPRQDAERARKLGLGHIIVEWPWTGGGTWTSFGCSLLYRLPDEAAKGVREAISEICLLCDSWRVQCED